MPNESEDLNANNDATVSCAANIPELNAIALSLRIPRFWRDRPKLWFISFEAATVDLKANQEKLAQMVVAQLEKQEIDHISDLLYNSNKCDLYNLIKERLISIYEESDSRQLQKLLSEVELGDQKPTQLLRRMKNLARDKVTESTLRIMWTNLLPTHIRSVLAVSETFSKNIALDELALLADKMLEQSSQGQVSALYRTPSMYETNTNNMQFLVEEIKKLSLEMAEIKANQRQRYYRSPTRSYHRQFRPRSRSPSHSRSSSRSFRQYSDASSSICYYHSRFGDRANKCLSPCNFKKSEN